MSTPVEYELPASIPVVTVTGEYRGPDGRGLSGTVTFTGPGLLTFPEADLFIAGPVVCRLDEFGRFSCNLPATDSPDMSPSGWSYTVKENLTGVAGSRTFSLLLPAGSGPIDLADVAPSDPTTPNYVPVPGDSAYEVAVDEGFVGTETEWLASLVGAQGIPGPKGDIGFTGATGSNGDSAYEVAVDEGFVGTETEWLASLVGAQGIPGPAGADGTGAGTVTSVNTIAPDANGNVTLAPVDIGALSMASRGAANGVASLGVDGKVPTEQLPALGAVTSVNTLTGAVVLTAADLSALAAATRGAVNGVASLDSTTRLPVGQVPNVARNEWNAKALGFEAWSCDPYGVANPVTKYLKPGRLYFTGFNITESTTVDRIVLFARGYGGVSTNRYRAGIYRENGTKVVESSSSALTMAGQEAGALPAMTSVHVGAVPITVSQTILAPGRYWVAFSLVTGGVSDFAYFHVQNESPVATANFFMTNTPFARAWYTEGQGTGALPTTVSQTAAGALADHDIPIVALANV